MKAVLPTVCHREGEHGMAFAKRINELGYSVMPEGQPEARRADGDRRLRPLRPREVRAARLGRAEPATSPTSSTASSTTTRSTSDGQLLGRYIAEERDSGRLLRSCYNLLKEAAECEAPAPPAARASSPPLDAKVDALCRAVDELRQIVCAQTMEPAAAGNSKRK